MLVVAFQACLIILMEQFASIAGTTSDTGLEKLPTGIDFLLGLGTMIFLVVWQMLYLGFLATANTEGTTPQEPMKLIKVGRYFFWRIIVFELLFAVIHITIFLIILAIIGSGNAAEMPVWVPQVCFFASLVLLTKPRLLTHAIMIVTDCGVYHALASLKWYRLLQAKTLLRLFLVCLATIFLLSLAVIVTKGISKYAMLGLYATVSSTLMLTVALEAIRFIAEKTKPPIEEAIEDAGEIEDTEENER